MKRKLKIQTGKIYHVCNRGVDKRKIFLTEDDYKRFLESMEEFNTKRIIDSLHRVRQLKRLSRHPVSTGAIVKILAYCLLPNHFHLLLRQEKTKGVEKFMHKVGMGYSKYFNAKLGRTGALYQGPYNIVEIRGEHQLCYTSAYINANATIHGISGLREWKWSSYASYMNNLKDFQDILKHYRHESYEKYVKSVIKESSSRKKELKDYLIVQ